MVRTSRTGGEVSSGDLLTGLPVFWQSEPEVCNAY